jgi:hypothetical protein
VDNYIIRIYRREKDNPRKLVGVVEEVGVQGKKAFTDLDDLWEILNSPEGDVKRQKKDGERKRCKNKKLKSA